MVRQMIQLCTAGVQVGIVAAAMAVVPMITFAQTTTPAIESAPVATKLLVTNSSPTGNEKTQKNASAIESAPAAVEATISNSGPTVEENGTGESTSVQTSPPARLGFPATVEVEIQSRFNELQRELLDDRADTIDWWLAVIAFVLTFFGIVVAIAGLMGFRRFREIENAAKNSVDIAGQHAKKAEDLVKKIEEKLDEAEKGAEAIRRINAEMAVDAPEEAKQAVANIRKNPKASLLDNAIADAVSLQQEDRENEAIEKWRAVANIAQRIDSSQAASAWVSVGYLLQKNNPIAGIGAFDQAIRLKPDLVAAYCNRGIAKSKLGRQEEALADFDEAIRINPKDAKSYYNRGMAKRTFGRQEEALADFDEAIRINPQYAKAYGSRGIAKRKLGRHEEALADFDEVIRINPQDAKAYYNRGIAYQNIEEFEKARDDLQHAFEIAAEEDNKELAQEAQSSLNELPPPDGAD